MNAAAIQAKGVLNIWQISKGYADVPEGQMHYRSCGDSAPSLLLLHSAPQSSAMFNSALPRIAARGITVVALDLPNSGESYITSDEPKIEEIAINIIAAAKYIGFAPPFSLVGHQAGATIAIYLAANYPKLIRKVILWGIPILGLMERGDVLREDPPEYSEDFIDVIQSYVAERYPDEGHPWQLKIRGTIEMLQTYDRRAFTTRPMALVDCESLLKLMKQPTLCMAGDLEVYQKSTMKAALLLQNGKYHNLGPAGCDVVDEFPDEYVQNVVGFLKSTPAAIERASMTILASNLSNESMAASGPSRRSRAGSIGSIETGEGGQSSKSKSSWLSAKDSSNTNGGKDNSNNNSARNSTDLDREERRPEGAPRPSDSERRPSGEKRRLSLKNIITGKF